MSKQDESALSLRIRRCLNARGHRVWKNHGTRFTERGLCDLTGVTRDGRGVALEVKLPGKESTLRADQLAFMRSVVRHSPLSVVGMITSVDEAIKACEETWFAAFDGTAVRMMPGKYLSVEDWDCVKRAWNERRDFYAGWDVD